MDAGLDYKQLWEDNVRPLTLYVRQWVGSEAEDVVSDAFIKLLQSPTEPDNPKAWLYRTARNTAIDRQRRFRWFKPPPMENWFEKLPEKNSTNAALDGEALTVALRKLPDNLREIIVSKIWGNLTFKEIAALTNRPLSSVHYDYQLGIEMLRKEMGVKE